MVYGTGRNKIILLRYSQKATTYENEFIFIVCIQGKTKLKGKTYFERMKKKKNKQTERRRRRRDFYIKRIKKSE